MLALVVFATVAPAPAEVQADQTWADTLLPVPVHEITGFSFRAAATNRSFAPPGGGYSSWIGRRDDTGWSVTLESHSGCTLVKTIQSVEHEPGTIDTWLHSLRRARAVQRPLPTSGRADRLPFGSPSLGFSCPQPRPGHPVPTMPKICESVLVERYAPQTVVFESSAGKIAITLVEFLDGRRFATAGGAWFSLDESTPRPLGSALRFRSRRLFSFDPDSVIRAERAGWDGSQGYLRAVRAQGWPWTWRGGKNLSPDALMASVHVLASVLADARFEELSPLPPQAWEHTYHLQVAVSSHRPVGVQLYGLAITRVGDRCVGVGQNGLAYGLVFAIGPKDCETLLASWD